MANQTGSTKFATQERLAFLDIGSQLLFCVATLEQMLHLPHRSEVRVANRLALSNLPHEKGWTSWALLGDC